MPDLFGHEPHIAALNRGIASNRLHHAWLLTGPAGVGKATFAHLAARRLLANAAGPLVTEDGIATPDTHPVSSLLNAESHPDFRLLERLPKESKERGLRSARTGEEEYARSITVDQVRGLQSLFGSTPFLSPWRVAIVDSVDDLERPAANALLKNLEEPPANCLFLLISHAPGGLLPTIRSRCLTMRFEPLSDAAMTSAMRALVPDATDAEMADMVRSGEGSPGTALRRRGLDLTGIDAALDRLARTGDADNGLRSALASKLALKAAQPRYEAFLHRVPRHIAAAARTRRGPALASAIRLWERARDLAETAKPLSLDPATVTFELAGYVAALAQDGPARQDAARHG